MIRKLITIILIISFIIILVGLTIYFFTSYSNPKIINIANFLDKQISVQVADIVYTLNPFDTKTLEVKDLRILNIIAKEGESEIFKTSISLPFNEQVIALYFSNIKHCYYSTNLSDNIDKLTFTPIESGESLTLYDNVNFSQSIYLLPGDIISELKPSLVTKDLVGILPIPCTEINDASAIFNNNRLFLNYNSTLQREYYFQSIEKIKTSESIDALTQISGSTGNIINYFNFGDDNLIFIE